VRLVGHFKNTRARGPAHVFLRWLIESLSIPGTMGAFLGGIHHQSQSAHGWLKIPWGWTYPVRGGRVGSPKRLWEKGHEESERPLGFL